eukprot:TRINITY_DN288_c0_g1_i3.p1 TRINITY_DN288_c0_g1~~TRINITY_DN288_c0_g1_i3.p1  ORF type:complete len:903 (-),score=89.95 TRINITY_DN288_c0_g1_i3:7767-10475(-)
MQRYRDLHGETYHIWKTIKNPKDGTEYTLYQPSFDRGDECSLIFVAKRSDGTHCAMKCYPKFWGNTHPELLETEANILKEMQDVKGLPKVFSDGNFVVDDKKYLPIGLANKGSLFNVIRETGPLSEAELHEVVVTLLDTLSCLHSRGVIHRNLNPKHILVHVVTKGIVEYKLCDYKYAFKTTSAAAKPKEYIGTPTYIAPEISENEDSEYSTAVDIWSLGVTSYHLITGRTPQSVDKEFPHSLLKTGKLMFPINTTGPVSSEIKEFIKACLCIDPSKRPTSEELKKHPFVISTNARSTKALGTILEEEAEQLALLFEKLWAERVKMPLSQKHSLDPYEELNPLGTGQFGQIWHARDKRTGVQYVAKVLRRTRLMDVKAITAMVGEISLLKAMDKSPYVINLKEAFIYKGDFYLILEYCNGGDLEAYIQNFVPELPLPLKELKQIAWNVANALNELHSHGRIHGELKARNVLLVKDDSNRLVDAKLCDLGLAQEVETLAGTSTIAGTIDYCSPEQWCNIITARKGESTVHKKVKPKSDVYSLGALLYFVTTGRSPFLKGRKYGPVLDFGDKKVHEEIKGLINGCLVENEAERLAIEDIIGHKLFDMIIDIPVRGSVMPYVYADYITKEGKMGVTVMECKRIGSDKELAVKIVDIKGRTNKEYMKRFTKVIDVLFKVSMIPTVIKIHDAFICKETLNIVMDYCNGGDLESYVLNQAKQGKEIPVEEKQFIAYCVVHGIHSIHVKHQTHKDLSPRNVLLEKALPTPRIVRARISDFGINRILLEGPTDLKTRPMNTCYVAPELAEGTIDYKVDVWSFGMMLYFLYFGMHAHDKYQLKDLAAGKAAAEIAAQGKGIVPANCIALLLKCISPNPAERPTTGDILGHSSFYHFEGTFAHQFTHEKLFL